jgi:PAS domain S-box-containing protein
MTAAGWDAGLVFDELSTASVVVDAACVVVAANRSAAETFGVCRDDMLGVALSELWVTRDYGRVYNAASSLFEARGQRVVVEHVRLTPPDGASILMTVVATAMQGAPVPLVMCEFTPELTD